MSSKHYFTQDTQNNILRYVASNDRNEKQQLYIDIIEPALSEMIEKVVYTFKFAALPNIETHKQDCLVQLITILEKFDVNHGSTAFAYLSVITKNYFIQVAKKTAQKMKREIFYEEITDANEHDNMIVESHYLENREQFEFWNALISEVDRWDNLELKEQDLKVLKAIQILLQHNDSIEIGSKKAYYLYIREITGYDTKRIVSSLNKFRKLYKKFRNDWHDPKKFH